MMTLKTFILTITVLLLTLFIHAQNYGGTALKVNMGSTYFNIPSAEFYISTVTDKRQDRSKLGQIYSGVANDSSSCFVTGGIVFTYQKYFQKGFRNTVVGMKPITVQFNQLELNERKEDLHQKSGRLRQYKISVDYLLKKEGKDYLVFSDSLSLDSLSKTSKYNLKVFSFDFFNHSFKKLNQVLESNTSNFVAVNASPLLAPPVKVPDTTIQEVSPPTDTEPFDNSYSGVAKFKLTTRGTFKFNPYDLNELITAAISDQYEYNDEGKYTVEYLIKEKDGKLVSKKISLISYKASINPYWYITVPILILTGIISGSNG